MNRDSKIWLSKNIKLDKDYKAVLNYSESSMIELMTNQNNLVYYDNNYSFLRDTGEILVQAPYGTCLQANYIAYQNPDYSNKIFFGFIDECEYVSEKTTKIKYTIDIWTTWYSYWDAQACFVVREHVTDDSIGKHTLPENVETGDYISSNLQPTEVDLGDMCYVVAGTEKLSFNYSQRQKLLPTGVYYIGCTDLTDVGTIISRYDQLGKGDAIVSVFVAPMGLFYNWTAYQDMMGEISTDVGFEYSKNIANIGKPNYIGKSYTPKNNKLFTSPYTFLQVSNYNGNVVNYKWENFNTFVGGNNIEFHIYGTLTPSGSFYCFPYDYNNQLNIVDEIIPIGKLPIGAYNNDAYTNWLTQNGVNLAGSTAMSVVGGIGSTALGIATANPLLIAGGVGAIGVSIGQTVMQMYQHSMIPDSVNGSACVGDANFQFGRVGVAFKRMTIKDEYAKVIDDYFTRQGYSINRIKVPNMGHRQNYNYVQIASDDNCARVNNHNNICPSSKDMESINNLFRRGITIWNNHANLGNYSVSNNITN